MREVTIFTDNIGLKVLFKVIDRYRLLTRIGDKRKVHQYKKEIDETIKEIKKYGLDLDIKSHRDITSMRIRENLIEMTIR